MLPFKVRYFLMTLLGASPAMVSVVRSRLTAMFYAFDMPRLASWMFCGVLGLGCVAPAAGQALAATRTQLPLEVTQALARAGVPVDAVAMVVAPLPPPPGTVSRVPEPVNPSGEANPMPDPAALAPPVPRLSWRADVPMSPASVMKLVTTYAGLDMLGPGYFWRTRVYTQGRLQDGVLHGNLLVQGSGDPKLVYERLATLIQDIQHKGVRQIEGDILLDNSIFRLPPHDPAAFDDDPLSPYNAGPDGLLLNFKALVLHFSPDARTGRVHVSSEPPLARLHIPADVPATKGSCGNWRARLGADFGQPGQISFSGRYPLGCGEQSWTLAYPDPHDYAPRMFEGMWRAGGGLLSGQARWMDKPASAHLLLTGFSLPLKDIVADINKFSNNVMAQQLFLTLPLASGGGHGSFEASRNALARWWRERFGLRAAPLMDNGSGLSRTARISAASLVALLQQAASGPHAEAFEQSLSIAGLDGTTRSMRVRSPGSEAIGHATLKTGTLRDVTAIAGYAYGRSGHKYAVAGLINHPNAGAARPALDRLLEWAVSEAP